MKYLIERFLDHFSHRNRISDDVTIDPGCSISESNLSGNIRLSEGCRIYKSFLQGEIKIGRYTSIWGPNTDLIAHLNPIEIKQFVSIARNVSIQESNHKIQTPTTYNILRNIFGEKVLADMNSKGGIVIGNDVWIGSHAIILSGVNIGNGAVIGANSVVTRDVPPYAIMAGNPLKIIRYRFNNAIIEELERIRWWDWDLDKIKRNFNFFSKDVTLESLKGIEE